MPASAPPSIDDLCHFSAFAERLADAAAAETVSRFRVTADVVDKSGGRDFDPVTDADRLAEAAIRRIIEAKFPDHGVSGEEFGDSPAAGPYTWTLDPIDGTRAFIAGIPLWTTLIALSWNDEPVLGLVDQPYIGERYVGYADRAVFRRDARHSRLRVRSCAALRDAVISTTDPNLFDGAEAAAFEQLRATAKLTRYGCDAYAYMQLAAGHVDLVAEAGLQPHDVRALVPIVRAAGGVLTDWYGESGPDSGQVIAAGDPRVLNDALVSLKRSAR